MQPKRRDTGLFGNHQHHHREQQNSNHNSSTPAPANSSIRYFMLKRDRLIFKTLLLIPRILNILTSCNMALFVCCVVYSTVCLIYTFIVCERWLPHRSDTLLNRKHIEHYLTLDLHIYIGWPRRNLLWIFEKFVNSTFKLLFSRLIK